VFGSGRRQIPPLSVTLMAATWVALPSYPVVSIQQTRSVPHGVSSDTRTVPAIDVSIFGSPSLLRSYASSRRVLLVDSSLTISRPSCARIGESVSATPGRGATTTSPVAASITRADRSALICTSRWSSSGSGA
jgi:hypothetical protein